MDQQSLLGFSSIADHARWHTGNDRVFRNIMGDHRTRTDNCMRTNVNARQDAGVHSDIRTETDCDRPDDEISLDDWFVYWQTGMD
jgi:hypothetical protein